MQLDPVARRSLSDAVFEQLRDRILSGLLAAGSALPGERALCTALGVNRGALREGLKRLEQARLVAVRHGGGTTVLDFRATAGMELLGRLLFTAGGQVDMTVARSIVEMRSALGPDIARRAAERRTPAHLARLDALIARMHAAEGALDQLQLLALELWDTLVEASGNVAYRLAFNSMSVVYRRVFELLAPTLADELRAVKNYAQLVDAVRAGEPALAERRARGIIRRGEDALSKLLQAVQAEQVTRDNS